MMMDDGFSLVSMRFAVGTDASDELLRKVVESSVTSTGVDFSKGARVGSDFSCDMTKALPYAYRAMFVGDGAKDVDADDFAAKFVRFARVMGMTSGASRLEVEDADIILSTLHLGDIWASAAANRPVDGNVIGKSHVMDGKVVSDDEFVAEMVKANAIAMEKEAAEAKAKAEAVEEEKTQADSTTDETTESAAADDVDDADTNDVTVSKDDNAITNDGDTGEPSKTKNDGGIDPKDTQAPDVKEPSDTAAIDEAANTENVPAVETIGKQVSETVTAKSAETVGTVGIASVPAYVTPEAKAANDGVSDESQAAADVADKVNSTKADALIRSIEQSAERTDESVATIVNGIDVNDLD